MPTDAIGILARKNRHHARMQDPATGPGLCTTGKTDKKMVPRLPTENTSRRELMPYIREKTTLEDIKAEKPKTIWYSVNTCWWTHRQNDLRVHPESGLPCDPRGGMLMMGPAGEFIANAEANPEHYGKHGLDAFIAAHNDNCVVHLQFDHRPTCLATWDEYNKRLDNPIAGLKLRWA